MGSSKNRRIRSLLIDPVRQTRLWLYFVVLSGIFLVVVALLFLKITYDQHLAVMAMLKIEDSGSFWDLLENPIVHDGLIHVGLVMIVFLIVALVLSIVITHRIFGPLVSIRRMIRRMSEGNYEKRLDLRPGDELHDLAGDLNHLADTLQQRNRIEL